MECGGLTPLWTARLDAPLSERSGFAAAEGWWLRPTDPQTSVIPANGGARDAQGGSFVQLCRFDQLAYRSAA